jgi:hypothetical protein
MKVKLAFLVILLAGLMIMGQTRFAQAIEFMDTKNGVTVKSWTTESYQGGYKGYDYWYQITNNSGYPMDEFYVLLSTDAVVFYTDYFGWGNTLDKLPSGYKPVTLHAWLTEFNPPQPTAQYAKGYIGDPWWTDPIEAVAPITMDLQVNLNAVPEPVSMLLLGLGLLGVAGIRRKIKK